MSPFFRRLISLILAILFCFLVILNIEWTDHPTEDVAKMKVPTGDSASVLLSKRVINVANKFCVIYNYTIAEDLSRSRDYEPISLALHSTMSYARYLVEQADTWDDFISYALLVEPNRKIYVQNLDQLWHCDSEVRRKVSLHLVWELSPFQTDCEVNLETLTFNYTCDDYDRRKAFPMIAASVIVYPINYLRNIARSGAGTRLHIVADMENIFCPFFGQMTRNETALMLQKYPTEKYVLVYRRFELKPGIRKPKTIHELWTLLKLSKATFFHSKFFPRGHFIPDLQEWLRYSSTNSDVISTGIDYTNGGWEPQFVMPSEAPFHYEEVLTRRYDHQVLVRELCRAGYKFRILSHVFNIHVGWKRNHTNLDLVLKRVTKYDPRYGNNDFTRYIEEKYPETAGGCPRLP
ncbi:hypothetical protein M3Y94_00045200 [Aphelenchoides besseyi]|nr:hypothetical protein M3Y94_00045200 [Aphelenchoides besseyi]KAI6216531.1 hypothetical protein M3Y95_01269800 [Aphelenchoides besseyi]